MQKLLFLLIACFFCTLTATAQPADVIKDPEAKAVLDKLKKRFDGFSTVQADFSLEIEIPGMDTEVQKGKLWQQGEKYRAELDSRAVISDGKTVWVYLGNNKEVQINCAADFAGEGMMSPKDLLSIYEKDDYAYFLANEFREDGKTVQQIEFKPTDRDSEYAKLRLTLDKSSGDVIRMKIFSKDGSRFTLKTGNWAANKPLAPTVFKWQKSECPDCYVEDLRLDCE